MFPEQTVRESKANMLFLHDLFFTGIVPIAKKFDGWMEIANPEKPLIGTQRFLDTPPKPHNESLEANIPWIFLARLSFEGNVTIASTRDRASQQLRESPLVIGNICCYGCCFLAQDKILASAECCVWQNQVITSHADGELGFYPT